MLEHTPITHTGRDVDRHASRLARLRDVLTAAGADGVVLAPGTDLRYLAGYDALAQERPTLLLVPAAGPVTLVAPRLERTRAAAEVRLPSFTLLTYGEHDDALAAAAAALDLPDGAEVAVGDRTWSAFTLGLQAALPGRRWRTAAGLLAPLRQVKDADELAALARVAGAIDDVHRRVPDLLRAGRTEREVAADLAALIREGHDSVSFVIVASGPNAASPHHEPGERPLAHGDAVVVDIGGLLDGYGSDMTRTYAVGTPPDGFVAAYDALQAAQAAAVAAVQPGVTAGAIDAVARDALTAAGLGDAFVHRTGHGIGLDTHEEPWILAGSDVPLTPGMAFSVEPGFYLEGRYGARIEDIVVVTDDGVRPLNRVTHDLVVVP